MAEGGDITSSLLSGFNSATKSQPEIEISKEDAAWVDSCFVVSDAEISDDDWNRVIDFLFDTQMISADEGNSSPVSAEEEEEKEDPFDEGNSSPVSVEEEEEEDDFDFHENIFKVWDLRTQVEEDEEEENELIKQLNRALSESRNTVRPLSLYEPTIASEEEEELVAGLADLSLETSSE